MNMNKLSWVAALATISATACSSSPPSQSEEEKTGSESQAYNGSCTTLCIENCWGAPWISNAPAWSPQGLQNCRVNCYCSC
jgi:hypothetical protein